MVRNLVFLFLTLCVECLKLIMWVAVPPSRNLCQTLLPISSVDCSHGTSWIRFARCCDSRGICLRICALFVYPMDDIGCKYAVVTRQDPGGDHVVSSFLFLTAFAEPPCSQWQQHMSWLYDCWLLIIHTHRLNIVKRLLAHITLHWWPPSLIICFLTPSSSLTSSLTSICLRGVAIYFFSRG